jgi:hypothetical protein
MAVKTTLEQLEEVQAAITNCLSAQSVGSADKTVLYARLDFLQKREDSLLRRYNEEQVAASSGSGMFKKVRFDEPI